MIKHFFKYIFVGFIAFLNVTVCFGADIPEIEFNHNDTNIIIHPSTLEVTFQQKDSGLIMVSSPIAEPMTVESFRQDNNNAAWEYRDTGVSVEMSLLDDGLHVDITAEEAGEFTWPSFLHTDRAKALIWPRHEGDYIPLDDKFWTDYLVNSEWNTLEGICLPFWGVDCGDYILTYIATNQYKNEIKFKSNFNTLTAEFTHEFTPNNPKKEYGFVICLDKNTSPVIPAVKYREWLIKEGKFVSLQEKMKNLPKLERLKGAAHAYLWGDAILTRQDIPRNKWKVFCQKLIDQSKADDLNPGKRIKSLMDPKHWDEVVEIAGMEWPYDQIKSEVTNEISRLLTMPDFYDAGFWKGIAVPEISPSPEYNPNEVKNIVRQNGLYLKAAYPDFLLPFDDWGDGVSVKMLKQIKDAGFDRMRFCLDGWENVEKKPYVAAVADEMGYLFGTYDSYHSIHDPKLKGTDATWITAQFDRELFEKGPIVRRDGVKRGGFQKRGYKLSPIAARPYVEKRVNEMMRKTPFNYYFMDCDAFGEVYDDYSPLHPCTQEEDALARADRLRWISQTHNVVIGSEGGSSYAAPVIHVAEGITNPVIGWGDPDMKDRNSEYYLGQYYPPDGPKVFTKTVPLKDKYVRLHFDPKVRLPLYNTVFHDSVVTTHHWSAGSTKFSNVADVVTLSEMAWLTPPMYHLNLDEFKKIKDKMKKHYDFFSPLHSEFGFSQMTGFNWLTDDHLVQRTVFAGRLEMIANYSDNSYNYQRTDIPPRSVLAFNRDTKAKRIFTP